MGELPLPWPVLYSGHAVLCCAVLYELVGYTEGSLEVIFGMFECCSIYHDDMPILAVLLVDESEDRATIMQS
jgi:hypothetical protein